ncbi:GTP cyclohydrolase I [Lichenihabitans sp. PAMC28606]|uniref:GTP cyclohydrolase I n=1 Tax=Lichenihabitans sp. PAMC28606 TaxID=2880932 RepID=UPI001D09C575|nr:GTP cyclohydrolase I [Lichenihabitans sp. PAMC28606]UDL94434.1 GTP cyclohydrolase I [Lichenihabitans sp. PAMC28606]
MNELVSAVKVPSLCNEPVHGLMNEGEREAMKRAAAQKIEELFDILFIDHRNDHNTRDTPQRVAKMFVEETMRGRYSSPPRITDFDNVEQYEQLIVTGPIELRSTCAHHLMPIFGHVMIGILPAADGKIIGLSKYDRIVEHFAARLQIQEELIKQIERYIVEATKPRGLAVRISAVHMCKTHRGVKSSRAGRMVNSSYYGDMMSDAQLRAEFLQECVSLERNLF